MTEKFFGEFNPEKGEKFVAPIKVERIFEGEKDHATIERDGRKLEIERIDDETLRITEQGSYNKVLDDGRIEEVLIEPRTEFVLPIFVVDRVIPIEKGTPGAVTVKEGWAYPWGDISTFDAYKASLRGIIGENVKHNVVFNDGLPERVLQNSLSLRSGYLAGFEGGGHHRTLKEAMDFANELSERSKELDTPSIESPFGKITPRELSILHDAVAVTGRHPSGDDEGNEPSVADFLYAAGFTPFIDSLEWAAENLPRPQEEYDANRMWGELYQERDRLKKYLLIQFWKEPDDRYLSLLVQTLRAACSDHYPSCIDAWHPEPRFLISCFVVSSIRFIQ